MTSVVKGGLLLLGFLSMALLFYQAAFYGRWGWRWWARQWRIRQRQKKREEQWPEALLLMASCLQAGLTLQQSIRILVSQSAEPLRSFLMTHVDLSAPAADIFSRVFSDSRQDFLRTSCLLAHQMGAPYATILLSYAKQLRRKKLFYQRVLALTAQSRMTAKIVAATPLFFGGALALFFPEFVTPLWNTKVGGFLLILVVFMNGIGFWMIHRLMRSVA